MKAVQLRDSLHVRVDALTSQSTQFRSLIADFFRTEFMRVRSASGVYEVVIEIERTPDGPAHDVDSVAKAVLDALSSEVFADESQVVRLHVEKVTGERPRVKVRARPLKALAAA